VQGSPEKSEHEITSKEGTSESALEKKCRASESLATGRGFAFTGDVKGEGPEGKVDHQKNKLF